MKKHSEILYLFLVVVLVLNLVLPASLAIASAELEVPLKVNQESVTENVYGASAKMLLLSAGVPITDNIITSVQMYNQKPTYIGGVLTPQGDKIEDARPKVTDEVAILFEWSLPDDTHSYSDGSTYTFQLPAEFKIESPLNGDLDGEVGKYVVTTSGEVTFTFNNSIWGAKLNGNFYVWIKYDQSQLGDGLEHPIDFNSVGLGVIDVHFANTAKDELTKTGLANKNNINSDEIVWMVDFNQGEKDIKDAVFTDILPSELTLKGNIEVHELTIQLDGSVKVGPVRKTETAFPIILGNIDKAYRVTYTTTVIAPTTAPFKNREFVNKAELTGDSGNIHESDIGKVTVNFNEPLSKSGSNSTYDSTTQTITWKVQYNYNQQTISGNDAWIEDVFDITKYELVADTVKVNEVDINSSGTGTNPTLVDPSLYTITGVGNGFNNGFKLKFNNQIEKAYEIEYQTKAINRIYKDETVSNTVTMYDGTNTTGQKDIKEVIFVKSVSKEDFNKKEIEWKIVLNKDLKLMTDVVITDNYEGKHMKLKPDSVKINGQEIQNSPIFEFEANMNDLGYDKGFTIKLKSGETINSKYEITYTTSFDPTAGKPTNDKYENKATLNWIEGSTPQTPITKSASVTPQSYTLENGNKKGEYSAKDKTITWTIDVNYNLFDIKNAVIKDNYTGDQIFVDNSLKVNLLELKGANNVTDIGSEITLTNGQFELNSDGKGFMLNLGDIGKNAYRITYKTSLDGNYPIQGSYSNHATLHDGEGGPERFTKSFTVTPANGGEYIEKFGKQKGQTDVATWTVNINPSQSYVAAGAVLTDTLSDNQILLEDTLKLYKTELPANNSGNVSTKGSLVDKGDYTLVFDGNTFRLTFNKALNTAYILEYESFINADSGERIKNKVEFAGQSSSVIGEGSLEGVKVSFAGAGGGASSGSGKIKIVKVDDLNHPIEGVVFELYNASGTTLLETLKPTDVNGVVETSRNYRYKDQTGLPYKLKEVSVPSGYLIDPEYGATTGKEIQLKDPSEPFKVVNETLRQGFELTKFDAADQTKKLQGAVFELKLNGMLIDTLTTGIDGKIAKGELLPGDYQLVEITAPDYYMVDATPIAVKIIANQTEVLILAKTNVQGSGGKLVITKVDAKDKSFLSGVEFELRDSKNDVMATKTTDANGVIEFTNLPYGLYTLVETKAEGYVIEKAETELSIKQPETTLTIENKENDRSVKLTKYNLIKSHKLQGAVFELKVETEIFDKDGNFVYKVVTGIDKSKLTTDINGELLLENLEPNKYQLVEIKAPFGYLLDESPVEFEITVKQIDTILVEKTNNRVLDPVVPNVPTEPGNPGTPVDPIPNKPIIPTSVTPVDPNPAIPVDPTPVTPVDPQQEKPVKVDVNDIPRGGTDGVSKNSGTHTGEILPQTGESSHLQLQRIGFSFIILGAMLLLFRNRRLQNK